MAWPVDARPNREGRVIPTETQPPPEPGHADTLVPSAGRSKETQASEANQEEPSRLQSAMLENGGNARDLNRSIYADPDSKSDETARPWYPKPPKVLMEDKNAIPLELRLQIQLYATNEYVLEIE